MQILMLHGKLIGIADDTLTDENYATVYSTIPEDEIQNVVKVDLENLTVEHIIQERVRPLLMQDIVNKLRAQNNCEDLSGEALGYHSHLVSSLALIEYMLDANWRFMGLSLDDKVNENFRAWLDAQITLLGMLSNQEILDSWVGINTEINAWRNELTRLTAVRDTQLAEEEATASDRDMETITEADVGILDPAFLDSAGFPDEDPTLVKEV